MPRPLNARTFGTYDVMMSDGSVPRKHGVDVVPPRVVAGPSQIAGNTATSLATGFTNPVIGGIDGTVGAGDVPFWQPGLVEVLGYIGWRWAVLAPAVILVVAVPVPMVMRFAVFVSLGAWLFKFWALALGLTIYIMTRAIQRGVRDRPGMFCVHCGYDIEGLGEAGTCPECGRHFVRAVCEEYKKDPHFFIERFKALRALPKNPGASFAAGPGATADDGTQ